MMRLVASAASGAGPLGGRIGPMVQVPGKYHLTAVPIDSFRRGCAIWRAVRRRWWAHRPTSETRLPFLLAKPPVQTA